MNACNAKHWALRLMCSLALVMGAVQLAMAGLVPARKSAPVQSETSYRTQVKQALHNFEYADPADPVVAYRHLERLLSSTHFAALPSAQRHALLSTAGGLALELQQYDRARTWLQRAVEIDADHMLDWNRLVIVEAQLGESRRSADRLIELLPRWPQALKDLNDDLVFNAYRGTREDAQAHLKLLRALFQARGQRRIAEQSALWYELAVLLIERGLHGEARNVIPAIDAARDVVKLRIDRRFDALVNHADPAFDVERRALDTAEQMQALSDAQSGNLELYSEYLSALEVLGRDAEIVQLSGALLEAIEAAGPDQERYQPMDHLRWVMNQRANALLRLDREDEGLRQLAKAGETDEDGVPNVSQRLNLARAYIGLRRPEDALQVVADLHRMSGYGMMVLKAVQFEAAQQQSRPEAAAAVLHYLRTHREDSQIILLNALLSAGLLDEAASRLIELLQSEAERVDLLYWLQEFDTPPGRSPESAFSANWTALRDRPDVLAAVAAVGRMERYTIREP